MLEAAGLEPRTKSATSRCRSRPGGRNAGGRGRDGGGHGTLAGPRRGWSPARRVPEGSEGVDAPFPVLAAHACARTREYGIRVSHPPEPSGALRRRCHSEIRFRQTEIKTGGRSAKSRLARRHLRARRRGRPWAPTSIGCPCSPPSRGFARSSIAPDSPLVATRAFPRRIFWLASVPSLEQFGEHLEQVPVGLDEIAQVAGPDRHDAPFLAPHVDQDPQRVASGSRFTALGPSCGNPSIPHASRMPPMTRV